MVLSNAFNPDPRVYKEAKSLVEHGFKVTVYAWDRECRYPANEVVEGIYVRRVHIWSKYGNLFLFVITAPIFWLLASLRILSRDVDIIHCHDFDTVPVGVLVKALRHGVKLVYDAHEYYPSSVRTTMPKIIWRIVKVLHEVLPRKSDIILIVNDHFKRFFKGYKPTVTVINAPLSSVAHKARRKEKKPFFRVFYYGGLSRNRGVMNLIVSIVDLPGVELIIAGKGELEETIAMLSKKYRNLKYLGWITEEEISSLTSSSDLIPILYNPTIINNKWATPNKLFLAMVMGIPVIVCKGTLMEKIIKDERCGISVSYGDVEEIKKTIMVLKDNRDLYYELSRNGKRAFSEKYSWEIMEKRLVSLYESLTVRTQ